MAFITHWDELNKIVEKVAQERSYCRCRRRDNVDDFCGRCKNMRTLTATFTTSHLWALPEKERQKLIDRPNYEMRKVMSRGHVRHQCSKCYKAKSIISLEIKDDTIQCWACVNQPQPQPEPVDLLA